MPAFTPDVAPHEWELSDEGRERARELMARLPAPAHLVSSAEPKAWQTVGGSAARDGRFNEVGRDEPWGGDFRERRLAYVSGADHPGWEPRQEVAGRFDAGIREHLEAAGGGPVVVATHGMAMTVWLAARIGLPDPGEFWSGLRFPDAHVVDLDAGVARRV
ncbi:hypothetical protein GCM10022248_02570 [Nonomuraea soli]